MDSIRIGPLHTYMKYMEYVMAAPEDAHADVMCSPAMNISNNAIAHGPLTGYDCAGRLDRSEGGMPA